MKFKALFAIPLILLLSACGGGGGSNNSTPVTPNSGSGSGFKGPFVQNSVVTAYQLDTSGSRTASVVTNTTDNLGSYSFSNIPWSGATELTISGNYFDENTGSTSTGTVTLSAVVNVTTGGVFIANINVLTDLATQRTKSLMSTGSTLSIAQNSAQTIVQELFDLKLSNGAILNDLNLTIGSGDNAEDNAELLKISAAITKNLNILDNLRAAIVDGNVLNDSTGTTAIQTLQGNLPTNAELDTIAGRLNTLEGVSLMHPIPLMLKALIHLYWAL